MSKDHPDGKDDAPKTSEVLSTVPLPEPSERQRRVLEKLRDRKLAARAVKPAEGWEAPPDIIIEN